jgi:uncharacterized protein (TIGR00369 family)
MSEPDDPTIEPPQLTGEQFLSSFPNGMGALSDRLQIELVEVSPQRIVATMPVAGNTQPFGLLHGGASVALAESLGSVGSAMHAWPDRVPVGVDINATHHRSARAGIVTGVATAIHLGRTSTSYEIVITDQDQRRLCTARITCVLIPVETARPGRA